MTRSVAALLLLSACDVAPDELSDDELIDERAVDPALPGDPAQVMPGVPTACLLTALGTDVYDITGTPRDLRIVNADVDSYVVNEGGPPFLVGYRLVYDVQLCWGSYATYSLYVENEGDDLSLRVVDADGVDVVEAISTRGVGTVVQTPTDTLGTAVSPFVLTPTDTAAVDTDALLLLDDQVLDRLSEPTTLDGSSGGLAPSIVPGVYASLITDNEYALDTFRFRFGLNSMPADDRLGVYDLVDAYLSTWSAYAHPDLVHHDPALDAPDLSVPYFGGFFNGHEGFIDVIEADLAASGLALGFDLPFRRMPAWNSAQIVPWPFAADVAYPNAGSAVPSEFRAMSVCTAYPNVADEEADLYLDIKDWHGDMHVDVGITQAHDHPAFWTWHTLVNQLWYSWRQCRIE